MKNFNAEIAALASSFAQSEISPTPESQQIAPDPGAIESFFKEILLDIAQKPADFYQGSGRLKDDYGLDSLDMVELVMYCEKDLDITLRDHEWKSIKTADDFLQVLFDKCLVPA